jgi:hypothetical protein
MNLRTEIQEFCAERLAYEELYLVEGQIFVSVYAWLVSIASNRSTPLASIVPEAAMKFHFALFHVISSAGSECT